ncbi:MAG TPA: Ldh family oxidoreductase [Stellaceae bacterium]|nr:Ldh family oxidoreductase [Stellaceae bacterium]
MTGERVHLSAAAARELAEAALRGIGYDAEEAWIIADHVLDAALCGYEYSGLSKILNLPASPRFGMPRRPVSVLRETPVSLQLDGGNQSGMIALYRATELAIAKAKSAGIALVGLADSWQSGRSAYYVEKIARAGLVAIHTASSTRMVAPFGGAGPALGTNPIAIGLPSDDGAVVLDMGTSAFMMSEVMHRERIGELLPDGVALGPDGAPTRDPSAARAGALLPFGGYKGFGLALMIQALGLLAGAADDVERDNGYLFIVFKPDLLSSLDRFKAEVSALLARVKSVPRAEGTAEIRIPSERAFRTRERLMREGIEIDRSVYEALLRLKTPT